MIGYADWDIFDVIRIRKKCHFKKAQEIFAKYLGIKDMTYYAANDSAHPEPMDADEPDEPVSFLESIPTDPQVLCTLDEAALLYHELLVENPDSVVSRDLIIDRVWGDEYFPSPRTIDNFILKLRNKIEDDPKNPRHIITVHGAGYRFKF